MTDPNKPSSHEHVPELTLDTDFTAGDNQETPSGVITKDAIKGMIIFAVTAIVSIILYHVMPFGTNVNKGLAILVFIGTLWLTEAIHVTATAILVPILAVLIGVPEFDTKKALASFADPIIFVFFGGFALAATLHVQKLDRKIAFGLVKLAGGKLGLAVFYIFFATAMLSMWISNTATAAMMLPLALGLLGQIDKEKDRSTFLFVLLGIAYCASIGGLGTMIGSPPNGIAAKALDLSFIEWMKFGVPMMLVMLPALLGAMYIFLKPNLKQTVVMTDEVIPWTVSRILTVIIFVVTAISWIFGKQLGEMFAFKSPDTVIALSAAVAVLTCGLVSWKQVSDNTDWGVLMLFGGGIALSNIMKESGASALLGEQIAGALSVAPIFVVILVITAFIIFLTEFTSNTASAALLVPLFAPIGVQLGLPPEALIMVIGIGASCAFMLPVATPPNAIVMGTGYIKQKEMMNVGLILNLVSIAIVTIWAFFFLR
ncbi:DASS family sodium-coupled anion symporter [Moraxella bovis]|uniref:SLC13 family permease n=1 Tax=Moraxella bovis TaxID=476 RepID=UPI0022272AB2|nr:DASS family sodium-coupled anion symporter [Moraxella bovis]UYZ67441.1 DASS family sodium-coupled anion symporter [Moraxella bovis]UZA28575.1 DASS family sodium-coupled anion symporter [Moraxella bovis]UZA36909.1 DASS family sodium-coupled anion symporter [Moraxella bovis]WAJ74758.1 DASS family sodium-coupled anion symporter [Moraxella bovis]